MLGSKITLGLIGVVFVQALFPAGLGNSTIPTTMNRPNVLAVDDAAITESQPALPTEIDEKVAANSSTSTAASTDNAPSPTPEAPNQPPNPPVEKSIPQLPSPNLAPALVPPSPPAPPAPAAPLPLEPAPEPASPASTALDHPEAAAPASPVSLVAPVAPTAPAPPASTASLQEDKKNDLVPPSFTESLKPSPPTENTAPILKQNTLANPQQRQVEVNSQPNNGQNSEPNTSVIPGLYFFPNPMPNSVTGQPSASDAFMSLLMSQAENKDFKSSQSNPSTSSSLPPAASSTSGSLRSSVTLMNDFVPSSFSVSIHLPFNLASGGTMLLLLFCH